jgi:hypothetical protein
MNHPPIVATVGEKVSRLIILDAASYECSCQHYAMTTTLIPL